MVSLNAEVDATIGYLLHHVARRAWCGLHDLRRRPTRGHAAYARLGSGHGVRTGRDRELQTSPRPVPEPDDERSVRERDGTSVEITTAAGDGTKLQIECAVVANVTGFEPDCRGMHGVPTTLECAVDDLRAVESRDRVVEYTLGGDFGAGVFVVGRTHDHEAVARSLRFYKMGPGPEYLFLRPYTLAQFEMAETIADVWINGHALATPVGPPVADVVTMAKRDLRAGESLDGIGGFTCYGAIDTLSGSAGCSRSPWRSRQCSEPTCPAMLRYRSTRSRSTSRRRSSRCVDARTCWPTTLDRHVGSVVRDTP